MNIVPSERVLNGMKTTVPITMCSLYYKTFFKVAPKKCLSANKDRPLGRSLFLLWCMVEKKLGDYESPMTIITNVVNQA